MGKRPVIQLLEPQADSSGPERKTRGTNPTVTGRAASLPDCLWQPFDIFPVWKCSTRGPNNRRHPAFCRFDKVPEAGKHFWSWKKKWKYFSQEKRHIFTILHNQRGEIDGWNKTKTALLHLPVDPDFTV